MELLDDWYASEDHMPGKTPMLRVSGSVRFHEGGWTAELRDHDGPQGINPRILIIDLVVTEPSGPIRTTGVEEVALKYEREVAAGDRCQYDQVDVHVVGIDMAGKTVDVECLEVPTGNA